jgi:hypothetical protein
MATIDSVIPHPVAKPGRRRVWAALAGGFVLAGVLATTAVIVEDGDSSSPAAKQQVTAEAPQVQDDPLVQRFGSQSTTSDDFAQQPLLRVSGPR